MNEQWYQITTRTSTQGTCLLAPASLGRAYSGPSGIQLHVCLLLLSGAVRRNITGDKHSPASRLSICRLVQLAKPQAREEALKGPITTHHASPPTSTSCLGTATDNPRICPLGSSIQLQVCILLLSGAVWRKIAIDDGSGACDAVSGQCMSLLVTGTGSGATQRFPDHMQR